MKYKNNKKGITLVEVIVVLVIMAVLAGVLVASYTGYIDRSKNASALSEARAVYLAVSSLCNEAYAGVYKPSTEVTAENGVAGVLFADISALSGVTVTKDTLSNVTFEGGKVTAMTYKVGGKTCTLSGTAWTVS